MIEQKQTGFRAVRIRTVGGNLSSQQLKILAELAEKYGKGQLHLTTRQSVEIHWIAATAVDAMLAEVRAMSLLPAVRGTRVLTVMACPGAALCRKGIGDAADLALQLNTAVVGREQPGKTKIAVSGCPNSCVKAQINDIGLHGVIIPEVQAGCDGCNACAAVCKINAIAVRDKVPVIDHESCVWCGLCARICPQQALTVAKQGYALYVGGKVGRQPVLGSKLFAVVPPEAAVSVISAVLEVYGELGRQGERIADVLRRTGLVHFRQAVVDRLGAMGLSL